MNNEASNTSLEETVIEEQSPKSTSEKVLSIVNIVVNSIFYFFIFLLLLFSISQIRGSSDDKVKNVFGLGYESVLTDSMYVKDRKESTFNVVDEKSHKNLKSSFDMGDLVWVKTVSGKEATKLKVGQIITFWDTQSNNPTSNPKGFLNTHRIVDTVMYNGTVQSYITQGDMFRGTAFEYSRYVETHIGSKDLGTIQYEMMQAQYIQIVDTEVVKAKYIGHWDNAGSAVRWLSNPKKGFIVVILFAGAFLIFEMFMVIKNVLALKAEKMGVKAEEDKQALKDEMAKSLEQERERMRKELLAELQAQQGGEAKPDEKSDDAEDTNELQKADAAPIEPEPADEQLESETPNEVAEEENVEKKEETEE